MSGPEEFGKENNYNQKYLIQQWWIKWDLSRRLIWNHKEPPCC